MKRGFGSPNFDPATKRRIQQMGGKAASLSPTAHKWTPEEARDAAKKGRLTQANKRRRFESPPDVVDGTTGDIVVTNGIVDMLIDVRKALRTCWPKRPHDSWASAEAQLLQLVHRGLAKDAQRIHVYECPECTEHRGRRTWHVGHPGLPG
jgi:hypothetical protein